MSNPTIEPGTFAQVPFINNQNDEQPPVVRLPSSKSLAERIAQAAKMEADAAELRKLAERERAEVEAREEKLIRAKAKLEYLVNSRERYKAVLDDAKSDLTNLRQSIIGQICEHIPTITAAGKILSSATIGNDVFEVIRGKYEDIATTEAMLADGKRVLGAIDDSIAANRAEVAELEA
jgi:hypothetical protein